MVRQDSDFVYALQDGVFEPCCRLGDVVEAGGLAGHLHDLLRPFTAPVPVHFAGPGTVVCMRGPGLAATGDCLMHLGTGPDEEVRQEIKEASSLRWLPSPLARPQQPRRAKRAKAVRQ